MVTDTQTRKASRRAVNTVIPFALTIAFAGLGHLSLRYWRRGLAWLGLFVVTLVLLSTYTFESSRLFVVSVLGAELPPMDVAFPGAILLLCLADLYLLRRFDKGHTAD